jgi:CheY-like chemotaxis protein
MWFDKKHHAAKKPLILVIDDDIRILQMLKGNLEAEGYQVAIATDGFAGTQMTWTLQPSLLILDIYMPGRNGLETLEAIRQRPEMKNIPVILVSGQAPDDLASQPKDPTVRFALVKKPLYLPEFNLLVQKFLSPQAIG